MMKINLNDIRSNITNPSAVCANLYLTADSRGYQKFVGQCYVCLPSSIKKNNCNNLILFVDEYDRIRGGQISLFSCELGLKTILF